MEAKQSRLPGRPHEITEAIRELEGVEVICPAHIEITQYGP